MDITLQVWGGLFYLINKILFALAEGKQPNLKRQLKIFGWAIYILGVPAWVIILFSKHNWIAASVEAGGVPSMLFGLYTVYQNAKTHNRTFDKIASFFTYGAIVLGVGYSLYDYGGISSVSQVLEILVMLGSARELFTGKKQQKRVGVLYADERQYGNPHVNSTKAVVIIAANGIAVFCHIRFHYF